MEKKDLILEGNMRGVVGWVCPKNKEPEPVVKKRKGMREREREREERETILKNSNIVAQ